MLRLLLTAFAAGPVVSADPASWREAQRQPDAWFATPAAAAVGATVVAAQNADGGWAKNEDYLRARLGNAAAWDQHSQWGGRSTIDNGATTGELRFLARLVRAAGPGEARGEAIVRGIGFLLDLQLASGGWPQTAPPWTDYHGHITYNDDAMISVLTVLRDVAEARAPFGDLGPELRSRAAAAVKRGIDCILRTQVVIDGRRTAWCAQHDPETLAPAWARNFEPPSLSGSETVGIVRFLMSIRDPSPEVIEAITAAVGWLERVRITGLRLDNSPGSDGRPDPRTVADPAAPPLWARFYELGSNRPLFVGRDRVFHYDFNEVERERRVGYAYLRPFATQLLEQEYPAWKSRLAADRSP